LGIVKDVLLGVLWFYLAILIIRMILSWIQMFSRSWRPTGIVLVIAEAAFTATDPPLRFLRRYIPSLRLGTVGFDLSFTVLFLLVFVLTQVVQLI
jgi:YggT family protein